MTANRQVLFTHESGRGDDLGPTRRPQRHPDSGLGRIPPVHHDRGHHGRKGPLTRRDEVSLVGGQTVSVLLPGSREVVHLVVQDDARRLGQELRTEVVVYGAVAGRGGFR